jgi:hypothetical protein
VVVSMAAHFPRNGRPIQGANAYITLGFRQAENPHEYAD